MNKKQICKINYSNKPSSWEKEPPIYERYGICLGDDKFLLENGSIIDTHNKCISRDTAFKSREYIEDMERPVIPKDNRSWYGLAVADASATRNVPAEIRTSMEKAYDAADKMIRMQEKYEQMREAFLSQMKEQNNIVREMPPVCRQVRGTLTKAEFAKAFYDALPDNIRREMENSTQRNYSGGLDGKYEVHMYQNIQIERSVWFAKWAKPSYSFLEYDDTRMIIDHPEKDPNYVRDLKDHSRPLSVPQKIEEYITIGDKNSLEYHGSYFIKLDPGKELTKGYAQKLADDFCGKKRGKTVENDLQEDLER